MNQQEYSFSLVDLTSDDSISKDYEVPPRKRHLGFESGRGTLVSDKISIRIGNNPIVYDLKKLYDLKKQPLPPEIQIFTSYEIWMVNFNVSVLKTGGIDGVKQVGLKVTYNAPDWVNIIEALPKSEFITIIDGKLAFEADLGINGVASSSKTGFQIIGDEVEIGLGGRLKLGTDNSIVGRLNFSVVSPLIMSVGIGSNVSEWIINKSDKPLYGDDLTFTNIILVKRDDRIETDKIEKPVSIEVEATVFATVSIYNLLPSRRSSQPLFLKCDLRN